MHTPPLEEDSDAMLDAWFDQQETCGMLVVSREELRQRIALACSDAYAEGRSDQAEEDREVKAVLLSALKALHAKPTPGTLEQALAAIAKAES
jgi:hypothetical protein